MEDQIFLLIPNNSEFEDMKVILEKEKAVEISKQYPNMRVEIFEEDKGVYYPTLNYYENGIMIIT